MLKQIFENNKGNLSYKRVTGFISLTVAILLAIFNYPINLVSMFLGYSATMGAGGLLEKDKKGLREK